jgi:hypothetical protein
MVRELLSRPAVLEILQELIRTPSLNPSLAPDEAHGEEAIAKVAQVWLAANGMNTGWKKRLLDGPTPWPKWVRAKGHYRILRTHRHSRYDGDDYSPV